MNYVELYSVSTVNIGIIGIGVMGSNLARCLHSKKVNVGVYNRTKERAEKLARELPGLRVYESPVKLLRESDGVVIFVSDDEALLSVISTITSEKFSGIKPLLVNASTVTPMASLRAMKALEEANILYSEGSVYGSGEEASECRLISYIACSEDIYERVKSIADLYSTRILYVGRPPRASVLKLALNNIGLSIPALLADSLALLRAWGIEESILLEASEGLWFKSIIERVWTRVFTERPPRFTIKLAVKDYLCVEKSLREKNIEPRLSMTIRKFYEDADRGGYGDRDYPRATYYFINKIKRE